MNQNTHTALLVLISSLFLLGNVDSLQAQTTATPTDSLFTQYRNLIQLNKAKNLARQAAEKANGGLSQYRAEPKMHAPPVETDYQEIAEGVWRFNFLGKHPSAENYSIESVVIVDTNTDEISIEYNGAIRP